MPPRSYIYPIFFLLLCFLLPQNRADARPPLVFAASSTIHALTEIEQAFSAEKKQPLSLSFAASSTLAKQIANGAPAHLFLSANAHWMDFLSQRHRIVENSRTDLLGNRLVLITRKNSDLPDILITRETDLLKLTQKQRIAMGDPAYVPAGIYAKSALVHLGMWSSVQPFTAPAKDVRSALAFVERGLCPLGIVYGSDAANNTTVRVIGEFPEKSHPVILYPVAAISLSKPDPLQQKTARAFLRYLKTPKARSIFLAHGFMVLP